MNTGTLILISDDIGEGIIKVKTQQSEYITLNSNVSIGHGFPDKCMLDTQLHLTSSQVTLALKKGASNSPGAQVHVLTSIDCIIKCMCLSRYPFGLTCNTHFGLRTKKQHQIYLPRPPSKRWGRWVVVGGGGSKLFNPTFTYDTPNVGENTCTAGF